MDIQEIQNEIFGINEDEFALMRELANEPSGRCLDAYARQGYGPYDSNSAYRALAVGQQFGIDRVA